MLGLRVLRALLLRFHRGSDGLCCPSYTVLMAATGLCRQSIANALKRLEAAGILRITRRLVREVIDAGGYLAHHEVPEGSSQIFPKEHAKGAAIGHGFATEASCFFVWRPRQWPG